MSNDNSTWSPRWKTTHAAFIAGYKYVVELCPTGKFLLFGVRREPIGMYSNVGSDQRILIGEFKSLAAAKRAAVRAAYEQR